MKKVIIYLLVISVSLVSCTRKGIIPKNTLADIYCDIYLADKYAESSLDFKNRTDSLLVYEPIFNKYGYTSKDYIRSSDYYLRQPDKFAKIFKKGQDKLKIRRDYLEKLLDKENGMLRVWDIIASLDTLASSDITGNQYYRALRNVFFSPDSIILDSSPIIDSSLFEKHNNVFFIYDSLPERAGGVRIIINDTIPTIVKDTIPQMIKEEPKFKISDTEKIIKKEKRKKPDLIKE